MTLMSPLLKAATKVSFRSSRAFSSPGSTFSPATDVLPIDSFLLVVRRSNERRLGHPINSSKPFNVRSYLPCAHVFVPARSDSAVRFAQLLELLVDYTVRRDLN